MNKTLLTFVVGIAVASMSTAQSFNFDDPGDVVTSPTQAAGTWYTDRYAPGGFESGVAHSSGLRLKHSISAADGANNRPGSHSSAFYNTQGRKYDLNPGTTSMSIDLYIDSTWKNSPQRRAGLWGTSDILSYPIVEFTTESNTGDGYFQVWNGASFEYLGLPTGFVYDSWVTLSITLDGANWNVSAGDLTKSFNANGASSIDNVILQGHNTTAGVDYDIYWDNFEAVPEPATMTILGLGALAALRRKKK